MTLWFVLIAAYAVSLLILAWNLLRTVGLVKGRQSLTPLSSAGGHLPSLETLIPVKDEAGHIAITIESVLAQQYPGLRILVVNDRSTDGTVAAVQALQDQHANIDRVDIASLPEGCYGKPHAMHSVAGRLHGEILAFVDSDLWLRPECLPTLIRHLLDNNLDWVATMGAPQVVRFWERLIVPLFGAVLFAWYDPRKVSDPAWPNAIGSALMVCRRSSYEAIGGHGAVIRIYDEDSELIRIAKRQGQRISFVLASELFTQRHYGSLAGTLRGLTRTFFGAIKTIPRMLYTMNALNFVALLPLEIAILAGVASLCGRPLPLQPFWLGLAVIHYAISTALAWLTYSAGKVPRSYAPLHPLGCAVLLYVAARAGLQILRGPKINWRGTTYTKAN